MPHFPLWLHWLSIASISLGVLCALVIAFDETRRPQSMWVMNCVWPLTALYAGIFGLAFYWRWSRTKAHHAMAGMGAQHPSAIRHSAKEPWSVSVAKATTHCGAGCTLGDIIAEWTAFLFPAVAVAFGWESLFAEKMFAVWVLDFLLAFLFGILFQYFTIQPMRHLSFKDGLVAALKADTASITAWQIGMYGMMAVAQFSLVLESLWRAGIGRLPGILVCHAARHALWFRDEFSGQCAADQVRAEGSDVILRSAARIAMNFCALRIIIV